MRQSLPSEPLPEARPKSSQEDPEAAARGAACVQRAAVDGEALAQRGDHDLDGPQTLEQGLGERAGLDLVLEGRVGCGAPMTGLSLAIVNAGREAGASLDHPHGQLLGIPFVPGEISEEEAGPALAFCSACSIRASSASTSCGEMRRRGVRTRRRSTSGMSGFLVWCAGVGGGAESREPSTQAS